MSVSFLRYAHHIFFPRSRSFSGGLLLVERSAHVFLIVGLNVQQQAGDGIKILSCSPQDDCCVVAAALFSHVWRLFPLYIGKLFLFIKYILSDFFIIIYFCMFSPCSRGLSPGTPASSRHPCCAQQ